MKRALYIFVVALFSCSSSSQDAVKRHTVEKTTLKDKGCESVASIFHYPDDLVRLASLNHICKDTLLQSIAREKQINLSVLFDDNNYTLFEHNIAARLLFDKRNDLLLCFRQIPYYNIFNRKTITGVYILNHNLLPAYSISLSIRGTSTRILKYVYEDKYEGLYVYELKVNKAKHPRLEELTYKDIIQIAKLLQKGDYQEIEHCSTHHSHFKSMPLWMER